MFYGRIHGFGFSVSLSLSLTSLGLRGARAGASRCRLPTSISKIVEWWKETRLCITLRDASQWIMSAGRSMKHLGGTHIGIRLTF
jgi:hypothetical protein